MPKLSFAQNRQNYVGMPLDAAEDTLGTLRERYIKNKDAFDKLDVMANNMEVLPEDEPQKEQAIGQIKSTVSDIVQGGDWENATMHIRQAAKDFSTDQAINNAVKSKKQRDKKVAELAEKVGKPFEEGGITNADFYREVKRADDIYAQQGGVYQDKDGVWKGHWSAKTPPAYLDRGQYIDEFLDGWESNKRLGDLVKGEDGKWYRAKFDTTPGGEMYVTKYEEEASEADLLAAARGHLLQNPNIRERIQYEVSNMPDGYKEFAAVGINRQAMEAHLKAMKLDRDFSHMDNDELTAYYKEQMAIYDSVKGAVEKHSFRRESLQVIGKTWNQIMREQRLKNAYSSGGDKSTVMVDRTISQYLTKGYSPSNIPKSIEDYQTHIDQFDGEIVKHKRAVEQLQDQIAEAPNPNDPMLQAELMAAQTKLLEYERAKQEYDYWYENAVKTVISGEGSIPKDEVDQYFRNKRNLASLEKNSLVKSARQKLGKGSKQVYRSGTLVKVKNNSWERIGELNKLKNSGKISQAEYDAYKKYAELKRSNSSIFGKMNRLSKKLNKQINSEMKRQSEERTVAYGYVDLSVDDFGKDTDFTKRMTKLLQRNVNNYRVLESDGEAVMFDNLDEDSKYDPRNTQVIGITTQYVGEHGYLLYAKEEVKDEDGNVTDERFHLIKPTSQDGAIDAAIMEVRKANRIYNNKVAPGYDLENPNELEQILRYTDVDRQLSVFDNHPIITPNDRGTDETYEEVTKPVNIGIRYEASVTRQVNNAGGVKWRVVVRDKNDGTVGTETYGSQYDAEHALEHIAGSGYQVPLSKLMRMNEYSFNNGNIDTNQISTPYLDPRFYDEMKNLDDKIGLPFTITSMTRSIEDNKHANGVETSRHKVGFGVDIRSEPQVVDWMYNNSTPVPNSSYRKINGLNIMYLVHDAGSGDHIHVEYAEKPETITEQGNIDWILKSANNG